MLPTIFKTHVLTCRTTVTGLDEDVAIGQREFAAVVDGVFIST
jgi:hypothetical protein